MMKKTPRLKIKGLKRKEALDLILEARIKFRLNFVQIAEKLNLDVDTVFKAHLELMAKKRLAWKPEIIGEGDEQTVVASWYEIKHPERKSIMSFKFPKITLNKKRGQTKKDARKDETKTT